MNREEIFSRLRPHQPALVQALVEILARHRTGCDLSDPGAGKTYVAAAVASLSQLPTLVVAPKVARATWERAAKHFNDSFSIIGYEMLRTGRTDFGKWTNSNPVRQWFFKCACCQRIVDFDNFIPCYAHPQGIHCIEEHSKPARYGKFTFAPEVRQVIVDEVHRCAGDSLNADMLIAAKRQGIRVLGLSATAACNPLQLRALGYVLDLHNLNSDLLEPSKLGARIARPSFDRWARAHGCVRDARFHGWKFLVGAERQKQIMAEIRAQIIPDRGVRVAWTDIPGFPARQIIAELYDLDHPEQIDGCYQRMASALERVRLRGEAYKDPSLRVSEIINERQTVEILKVPIFTELGQDYLEKGMSVVFFVNFRQTIDELKKRFPDFDIIDGSDESVKHRDEYVDKFQANLGRGLICNSDAGAECLSLHDLDGFHPRVGLVSLGLSAIKTRQLFGRLHRDRGKSPALYRVVLANKTIEVKLHKIVAPKLDNLDALNDADLAPENLRFQNSV